MIEILIWMQNKCQSGNQVTSGALRLSNQVNVTRPEIWTRTGQEAGCGCWCGESPEVSVLGRVERVINECYLEASALGRTLCFPLITLAGRKREGGTWGIGGIPSSKPGISLAFFHSASYFTCLCIDMMTCWGGGLESLFWVGDIHVMSWFFNSSLFEKKYEGHVGGSFSFGWF